MQGLAQDVTALRPELLNGDATIGELAWVWAKDFDALSPFWRHRLWFVDGRLAAWGWACLPHRVPRGDGAVREVETANLIWQTHPHRAAMLGEILDWYDEVAGVALQRGGVRACTADLAVPGDLHVLIAAPDGTLAATAIIWLDETTRTAEFEPVGTHRDFRRRGLGTALQLRGMRLAKATAARRMLVACRGAPADPAARYMYYGVGFRPISRDLPQVKVVR
ncbi:GNAT family N-acetyltransferase [Mesorhizobium sp. B3-1-9]|nr:GNAT family N-acetyltransferase [Mesorhizobium sp. B3-1-9]